MVDQLKDELERFKETYGTDLTIQNQMYLITKMMHTIQNNEEQAIKDYIDTRFFEEIIKPRIERNSEQGGGNENAS